MSSTDTDNQEGTRIAEQYLCDNVVAGGKVAILQGIITQSTDRARANGGAAAVKAFGLDLVVKIPAGWGSALGQTATEDVHAGNPDLEDTFASNDAS